MIAHERDFVEAAVAAVREAKELVIPMLMVESPDDPWNADLLRRLQTDAELEPAVSAAVDLLVDFEVPFLDEEARLESEGLTLVSDPRGFEAAMVDFERRVWAQRFEQHKADPSRWDLSPPVD